MTLFYPFGQLQPTRFIYMKLLNCHVSNILAFGGENQDEETAEVVVVAETAKSFQVDKNDLILKIKEKVFQESEVSFYLQNIENRA